MTTALGLAAAGLGVAILPVTADTSASLAICRVDIRKPALSRQIGILTRAGRSLPPAALKLVEVLQRSSRRRSPSTIARSDRTPRIGTAPRA
jgi:DNA-binding transcriptional LysR family regulator